MTKVETRFVLRCEGKCGSFIDLDVEAQADPFRWRVTSAELDEAMKDILRGVARKLGWRDDYCPGCDRDRSNEVVPKNDSAA